MISEETDFKEFMAAMGVSQAKFDSLHPAIQRAWHWNFVTVTKSVNNELRHIFSIVKGEPDETF